MEKVVVDTDIVIDLLRLKKGLLPQLLELQKLGKLEVYISSITIMELFAGEMKSVQIKMLSDLLMNFKIIPFDEQLARLAGELKRGKKLQIHLSDFIIGITSLYLKAYLATRNKEHFKDLPGVKFFD